jgi:hypothetical protein
MHMLRRSVASTCVDYYDVSYSDYYDVYDTT